MNKYDYIKFPNKLSQSSLTVVSGYTETIKSYSRIIYPRNIKDCIDVISDAKKNNLKICPRGNGYTYGDMIINSNNIIVDTTLMKNILNWNDSKGEITVQPGVTFAEIFKISLINNWTLSSCPGGLDITIGGSISNNVHGKDTWNKGNFGEQVLSLKLISAEGKLLEIKKGKNDLFLSVIGGMGLLGIIVEAKLKLNKIPSPFVEVTNISSRDINESINILDRENNNSDFSVAWVDCFSKKNIGRGYVSLAKWVKTDKNISNETLNKSVTKSKRIFNIFPSKPFWFFARPFFRPFNIRILNSLNYHYNKRFCYKSKKKDLFTNYNFMHNKIPDIRDVYRPHGFLEFQPLIPIKNGSSSIREIIIISQKYGCESLLCGMKFHKKDDFYLSYSGDGISLGIDIQLAGRNLKKISQFYKELFDYISDLNGKIYLAKDEKLDSLLFKKMYPNYKKFIITKKNIDPNYLFSSNMFKRILT